MKKPNGISHGMAGGKQGRRWFCEPWYLMTLVIFILFIIGDIKIAGDIQGAKNRYKPSDGLRNSSELIGHSIKSLFEDSIIIFVLNPGAYLFEDLTGLGESAKWLTANMVSTFHFCIGLWCGWLVASPNLTMRRLGVILFFSRSLLDNFDGIVAAKRLAEKKARGEEILPPNFFLSGYFLDGLSDMFSGIALIVGSFYFLWKRHGMLVPSWKEDEPLPLCSPCVRRAGFLANIPSIKLSQIILFLNYTALCSVSPVLWNQWVLRYGNLLAEAKSVPQLQAQLEVLSWSSTVFVFWSWRTLTLFFMNHFGNLYGVFVDKLWEFVQVTRVITWVILAFLVIYTLIHLHYVRRHLKAFSS